MTHPHYKVLLGSYNEVITLGAQSNI